MYWTMWRLILISIACTLAQAIDLADKECSRLFPCGNDTCHMMDKCLNHTESAEIFYIKLTSQKLEPDHISKIESVIAQAVKDALVDTNSGSTTAEQSSTALGNVTGSTEKMGTTATTPRTSSVATKLNPQPSPSPRRLGCGRDLIPHTTEVDPTSDLQDATETSQSRSPSTITVSTPASRGTTARIIARTSRTTDSPGTTPTSTALPITSLPNSTLEPGDGNKETKGLGVYFLTDESPRGKPGADGIFRAVILDGLGNVVLKELLPVEALGRDIETRFEADQIFNGTGIGVQVSMDPFPKPSTKKGSSAKYWLAAAAIFLVLAVAVVGFKAIDKYELQRPPSAPPATGTPTNQSEMVSISRRRRPCADDERFVSVAMSSIDGGNAASNVSP